jgi:hypothetical protein
MEQVLINVTDNSSFNSESGEEQDDWRGGEQQIGGVLNLLTYII